MNTFVTKILNGDGLAAEIRRDLKNKIAHFRVQPGLAIILVGHDPASEIYVDFKRKASEEVGIAIRTLEFEMSVTEKKLLETIESLNADAAVHGILVQLPLPDHMNPSTIIEAVNPAKDVDGLTAVNLGRLVAHSGPTLIPATPKGIWRLLAETHTHLDGKVAVVIGRSLIVGHPVTELLWSTGATTIVCHRRTRDLASYTKNADLLISAVGQANLITKAMVKPGAIIIDAGIVREKGRVVGDVDFANVRDLASYITPVPGGVGPMTVAALLENTWIAMRRQLGYDEKDEATADDL